MLFVGNSYTYFHDLPARLSALAPKGALQTRASTRGGAKLADHIQGEGLSLIRAGGWDFVVLQGHSLEALQAPAAFERAAKTLTDAARDAGAVPVLFQTWPRAPGHEVYSFDWSGRSAPEMQERLLAAYTKAANGGRLAPVGLAWSLLPPERMKRLYIEDGSHPSPAGTALAACVLYRTIFEREPARGCAQREK